MCLLFENMNKETYKKALQDGRVIIVGCKYSQKNGWTGFKVYLVTKKGTLERIDGSDIKGVGYWNEKGGYFKCGAWGTDRRLEIILSIGYALGLQFKDIRQNYQWLQDTWN